MEQLSQMLQYAEVTTDLRFVNIPTMPLEYRAGIELDSFALSPANDSAQAGSVSNDIQSAKDGLQMWRKHTTSKIKIFKIFLIAKFLLIKFLCFLYVLLN